MSDFVTDVEVNLTGDLAAAAQRAERAVRRMTSRAARSLRGLKSASVGLSNGIDKLGNRYTGLITGGAFAIKAKGVVDFDKRLKDIEVQAGLAGQQMAVLKKEMFDVAQDPNIRLDPAQLLEGFDAIIEKTGNFQLASGNIRNMGVAIRATGAMGRDIGAVVAGLEKLGITAPEEVAEALELLTEQGKAGAFTMQNMAAEAGPLLASMAAMGQKGLGAVRTMGALAQTTQMATDSAAESSTAIQSLIKEIAAKGKSLEEMGVTVFDQQALAEGKEKFLELDTIVKSIVEKSGGKLSNLATTFGDEAQKALKVLAADYQSGQGFVSLEKFLGVSGDTGQLLQDASSKAKTMAAAIDSLNAAMTRLANNNLSAPIQQLADAINSLDPDQLNQLFQIAGTGVAAAAAIWGVNKAIRGVAGSINTVRSLRQAAGGKGAAGALAAGQAQPVIVTNWPAGFGAEGRRKGRKRKGRGRAGSVAAAGASAASIPVSNSARNMSSRLMKGAGGLARRVGPVGTALVVADMGSAALEGDVEGMAKGGGALAGAFAGGKIGALAGTVGGPIGAAIGGAIGMGLGAYLGEEAVGSLLSWMSSDKKDGGQDQEAMVQTMQETASALRENTAAIKETKPQPRFNQPFVDLGGIPTGAP